MARGDIEVFFPLQGLNSNWASDKQPPLTTPQVSNMRPYDVSGKRARGGQRPGLVKEFATQIAAGHPVIAFAQVTTTYVPPEAV
jgi:hypothetical protein